MEKRSVRTFDQYTKLQTYFVQIETECDHVWGTLIHFNLFRMRRNMTMYGVRLYKLILPVPFCEFPPALHRLS